MPKCVITIADGLHYRYLVDTGVLDRVVAEMEYALVLTIPSLEEALTNHMTAHGNKVDVARLDDVKLSFGVKLHLQMIAAANQRLSDTVNIKSEQNQSRSRAYVLFIKLLKLVSKTPIHGLILKLTAKSFKSSRYRRMFQQAQLDSAILSTPGQKIQDLPVLYECIRAKLKTISPVYSWDNLTAKGPLALRVDSLVVWNDIMKEEAIYYHDYQPEAIAVTGVPVFDPYATVRTESPEHKAIFFKELNLDERLPLITVATIPTIFFGSSHMTLVRKLLLFMQTGRIPRVNILIRPHPKDPTDYTSLAKDELVKIDNYGSTPDDSLATWVPRKDNIVHLARTMKYSNVVINVASTITIDAACFNTPIINIAYDIDGPNSDYYGSVSRLYNYTHYKTVVESRASTLVVSDDHLADAINLYLTQPDLHSKERENLVRLQTGVLDGKAGGRVADAILQFFNSGTNN